MHLTEMISIFNTRRVHLGAPIISDTDVASVGAFHRKYIMLALTHCLATKLKKEYDSNRNAPVLSKSDGVDTSLLPVGLQKLIDMISPELLANRAAEPDAKPIGNVAAVAAAPVEDRLLDALDPLVDIAAGRSSWPA